MEPSEKQRKIRALALLKQYPRGHALAASALVAGLCLLATSLPSNDVSASRQIQTLELPLLEAQPLEEDLPLLESAQGLNIDAVQAPESWEPEPVLSQQTFTVKSGDSLSKLFSRAGLNDRDLYELINQSAEARILRKIMPGHQITFHIDEQGKLQQLAYDRDRLSSQRFERVNDSFVATEQLREPEVQLAYRQANISSSVFVAGQRAGLTDNLIMELAGVFGWDIDFALDIRKGDRFSVLYEEQFLDGEKIGNGAILAAEFTNQGRHFQAVRYTDTNNQTHYYTPEGVSMRKAFLQAPVDFRRISGNFNPNRVHPIFKTVRPHRGTDYAANTGTPVWASGDGKVVASAYSKANGNYVVLQHGNNIQTKYLHLNKRHVKAGQRVRQKQVIGTVGSTGYSTGPHLHYEFLVDGVHRNPRSIVQKLPKADSIAKAELLRFKEQTQTLVAQLEQYRQATQLAMNGDSSNGIN